MTKVWGISLDQTFSFTQRKIEEKAKDVWEALCVMASCRVDLTPTALPPPCQLHKTHKDDDDDDDNNYYDINDNNRNSTTMPTS